MAKAVLKLRSKPIPTITEIVRNVITKLTGNPAYPTPSPTLPILTGLCDDLDAAYQAAITKDTAKKKLQRIALNKLLAVIPDLLRYIQTASAGDETKILSAGVEVQKQRTPVGILPPPANIRVRIGVSLGEVIVLHAGVKGRITYRLDFKLATEDDTAWKIYTFSSRTRIIVGGLTSGLVYAFRLSTVSSAGIGPFSEVVLQKAL